MIYPSLYTIAERLNTAIYEKWGATINGTNEIVQLNNIANINDEKSDMQNKIVITLIKVEEEASLKNGAFMVKMPSGEQKKQTPAMYLNLYLLVSITKKSYGEALQLLSDTITFFQANKVLADGKAVPEPGQDPPMKITIELYDVHLQEVFDMWSNLGSKQFPSVMYKVRLIKLMDTQEPKTIPSIQTIAVQYDRDA